MDEPQVIIEVVGEGKTDIGIGGHGSVDPELPTTGIVPILVHKLCGQPPSMRVIRRRYFFAQGRDLREKVQQAKSNAYWNGSHSLVFVIDTEGSDPEKTIDLLIEGRDLAKENLPTVVGVAHPCIESWLLADPAAVKKGLELKTKPIFPEAPESLDAPQDNVKENLKAILAQCEGRKKDLSAKQKTAIANEMHDLSRLELRCPKSFKPFADEVRSLLLPPLFHT